MKLATGLKRFLASMADFAIVSFAVSIVWLLFSLPNMTGAGLFTTIEGVYFVYYESSTYRASPGKRLFGLYVATESGTTISIGQAVARYLLWRVSMLISAGLLVVLPFLIKNRCLHDMLTNTNVFSDD